MKPCAPGLYRTPDAEVRLAALERRWGSFEEWRDRRHIVRVEPDPAPSVEPGRVPGRPRIAEALAETRGNVEAAKRRGAERGAGA